jgi:hypothetical protein
MFVYLISGPEITGGKMRCVYAIESSYTQDRKMFVSVKAKIHREATNEVLSFFFCRRLQSSLFTIIESGEYREKWKN